MSGRKELAKRDGQRFRIKAKVERFGKKRGWKGSEIDTILFCDVVDAKTGQALTDHLWMTAGKWSQGLVAGSIIAFDARVDDYIKGYRGRREDVYSPMSRDWHLERPTKVVRLDDAVGNPMGV